MSMFILDSGIAGKNPPAFDEWPLWQCQWFPLVSEYLEIFD